MIWGIYFFVINVFSNILMKFDKQRAVKRRRRVRERTLFLFALIGGSIGIYSGMKMYRHKTKHRAFTIGIPIIILLQIALIITITK